MEVGRVSVWIVAQCDPRETAGRSVGLVDRQSAPSKIVHRLCRATPEEPKHRMIGVGGEHIPLMPSVSRDNRPRLNRWLHRRAGVQSPTWFRRGGRRDTLILEISLLIGYIRDQFFVDATPDIGQFNRVH
jgi:hypothetical protein